MNKKKKHIGKPSTKKILKLFPLFGIVIFLFIVLIGLLLWLGKIDKAVPAHGLFEPYPKIEIKATVKDTVINKILVEVGEKVKKGQILMRLKDQGQSKEMIAQLKERLKLANINFDRLSRLSDKGYVAVKDREEAELKINILTQNLIALQRKADALVIVAPLSGTVEEIPVEIGDAVDIGKKLVLLASSEEKALRMWIKEEDSSEVKLGQKVRIYSQIFYYRRHGIGIGKIVEIKNYPKLKNGKNYIEAVARITESPFPVRVGSRAEVKIIIRRCSILKLLFKVD